MTAFLLFMLVSTAAFGQVGSNASLSGTVTDASKGVIPGASVTARNTGTGVETKVSANASGIYTFASLAAGVYTVTTEASGMQRNIMTDVQLRAASQNTLNFELAVAGSTESIEVTASADSIILEAGASTGTVLQENAVVELPLLSSDTLDLVKVMGGVVNSDSPLFGGNDQTFAGVNANNINVMRDGISVNANRPSPGLSSPGRLNPELVGEFKMILSPVDAELGRGAGQVQMTTRSGTNAFHGSGVWNIQNTALDAYDFNAKHVPPEMIAPRAWRNLNNYTLTASGPIIKNKTFFFVSWDQAIARSRTSVTYGVLTPCARKGIYRWLDSVRSANASADPTTLADRSGSGSRTAQRPVVDINGQPLETYTFPVNPSSLYEFSGQTVTNELRYMSVLGELSEQAIAQIEADPYNCSMYEFNNLPNNGVITGTAWDDYRNRYDQSGFITRFSDEKNMPLPNNFQYGDGLNVAGERWTRTLKGEMTVFGGSSYDDNRKAVTFKVDHNINDEHRVSVTFSDERNVGAAEEGRWTTSYGGLLSRHPSTLTAALTSTLAPTLLNEFRVGMSKNVGTTYYPPENPENGDKLNQRLLDLLPTTADKFPNYVGHAIVAGPGSTGFGQSTLFHPDTGIGHPVGSRGNLPSTSGPGSDLRWTFNEAVTWMKDTHAFKAGIEFRRNSYHLRSNGAALLSNSLNTLASVKGGVLTDYSDFRDNALGTWVGMPASDYDYVRGGTPRSGNYASAYNLMTYITGSIGEVGQYFYMTDAANPRWNDVNKGEEYREADLISRDWSFFFKDDWKVTPDLTLNLGVRWEYSGLPHDGNGLGANIRDGLKGALGASGLERLEDWMPVNPIDSDYRTQQIFIGPGSQNPDEKIFNKDLNNWAPHVGFAWQLPWFGRGRTTLRGGYSISYPLIGSFDANSGYGSVLQNNVPGTSYTYFYRGSEDCLETQGCYLNFDNFGKLLPLYSPDRGWIGLPVDQQPAILNIQPIEKRDQALRTYDPNIRTPYVQSLNVSLTRSIGSNFTADIRYIGTLSRKMVQSLNLNTANLINNGLMEELIKVRAGNSSEMLDQYIKPGTLYRVLNRDGSVSGDDWTGSEQIRRMYAANLATGNLVAVANSLATANGANSSLGPVEAGVLGRVLRNGGAPETLIYANPQYASVTLLRNYGSGNYHSMQAQLTMRPRWGLNFQTTYTWSRNLGKQGITDYRNWNDDYWLNPSHRSHTFTSNGNYTLPFGPNGFLLRDTAGAFRKAVEGWSIGWIMNLSSGAPMSLAGITTLWTNGSLDQVGPFDTKSGKVEWDWETSDGYYFGKNYMRVNDPQCDTVLVADSLKGNCRNGMKALALVSHYDENNRPVPGQIVFQNAEPGRRGNFTGNPLTGIGRFSLDMNIAKAVEFMEGKRLELRIDASNVLNHASPSEGGGSTGARINNITAPYTAVNTQNAYQFGRMQTKTQHRVFQARIRFSF